MSQRAFLAELESDIHAVMAGVGLADFGVYSAEGAGDVACRVYVDQNVQPSGDYNQVVTGNTQLRLLRADVAIPQAGATVTVDGQTYTLDTNLSEDEAESLWSVVTQ